MTEAGPAHSNISSMKASVSNNSLGRVDGLSETKILIFRSQRVQINFLNKWIIEQIYDDSYKWLNQQYKEMIQNEKIQLCPWFLWSSPSALIYLWIIFMCDISLDDKYSADIERSFV